MGTLSSSSTPMSCDPGYGDLSVSAHWHWHTHSFTGQTVRRVAGPWRALSSPGTSSCQASRARGCEEGSHSAGKEHTAPCTGSGAGMQTATGPPNRPDSWEAGNMASDGRRSAVGRSPAAWHGDAPGQTAGHQETAASQTNTLGPDDRCGQRAVCARARGALVISVSQRG